MWTYLFKRTLIMLPTLFGITVITFLIVRLAPGDPATLRYGNAGEAAAGANSERSTESAEKRFRERHGFNQPLPVQFGMFLKRLITFDMRYYNRDAPIWPELRKALWVSLWLNLIVFVLTYVLAVPVGILSAAAPNTLFDRWTAFGLFLLYSLPTFFAAELLRILFINPRQLIWFPVVGLQTDGFEAWSLWAQWLDYLHHIVLPVICLTYGSLAYLSRQMRIGMLEVIRQDYIRTAEAKGCSKPRVVLVHALRNGLFPVITLFASQLPAMISGSVIVETIFNIPGMGRFVVENMFAREYDAVMFDLVIAAVLTMIGILIADVLYVLVNPRVSLE